MNTLDRRAFIRAGTGTALACAGGVSVGVARMATLSGFSARRWPTGRTDCSRRSPPALGFTAEDLCLPTTGGKLPGCVRYWTVSLDSRLSGTNRSRAGIRTSGREDAFITASSAAMSFMNRIQAVSE